MEEKKSLLKLIEEYAEAIHEHASLICDQYDYGNNDDAIAKASEKCDELKEQIINSIIKLELGMVEKSTTLEYINKLKNHIKYLEQCVNVNESIIECKRLEIFNLQNKGKTDEELVNDFCQDTCMKCRYGCKLDINDYKNYLANPEEYKNKFPRNPITPCMKDGVACKFGGCEEFEWD